MGTCGSHSEVGPENAKVSTGGEKKNVLEWSGYVGTYRIVGRCSKLSEGCRNYWKAVKIIRRLQKLLKVVEIIRGAENIRSFETCGW